MERICPKPYENIFICNCMPQSVTKSISELGFYSLVISNGDELVKNEVGGCLVRTKSAESDEGGVATGCSVLSSLYLNDKWSKSYYFSTLELELIYHLCSCLLYNILLVPLLSVSWKQIVQNFPSKYRNPDSTIDLILLLGKPHLLRTNKLNLL